MRFLFALGMALGIACTAYAAWAYFTMPTPEEVVAGLEVGHEMMGALANERYAKSDAYKLSGVLAIVLLALAGAAKYAEAGKKKGA